MQNEPSSPNKGYFISLICINALMLIVLVIFIYLFINHGSDTTSKIASCTGAAVANYTELHDQACRKQEEARNFAIENCYNNAVYNKKLSNPTNVEENRDIYKMQCLKKYGMPEKIADCTLPIAITNSLASQLHGAVKACINTEHRATSYDKNR